MRKPPVSERFLQSFDDPTIFDCGAINLMKVVQDALIREVGKNKSGAFRTYFNQPKWFLKIYFGFKSLMRSRPKVEIPAEVRRKKLLAAVPPRFVPGESGAWEQQYLSRLFAHIPRKEMVLMDLESSPKPAIKPDITKAEIFQIFDASNPDDKEWLFLFHLKTCFSRIKKEGRFTGDDLQNIAVGFDEFWRQYRVMNLYLRQFSLKKALLIPGYYTEFLIATLRNNNVEIIELQHGVITAASHFYIYSEKIKPVVSRALFADRIWVFGEYWKEQLQKGAEFETSQIEVLGDYFVRHANPPSQPERFESFSNKYQQLVLVGTQTKRHQHFIRLVEHLSEKYSTSRPQAGIVIKLHPAEDSTLYQQLKKLPNVLITDASLDFLYPRCEAYVGMYSNTIFEASRHNNLSIFVLDVEETAEFIEGIAASGVAKKMSVEDDPLELNAETTMSASSDYFFCQELDTELLRSVLKD